MEKFQDKQIVKCEHCGNKSPHEVIFKVNGPDEIIEGPPGYGDFSVSTYYFVARCGSCSEIALFTDWEESDEVGNLNYAVLLYPIIKKFSTGVPVAVFKDYDEAKKVKKTSQIAFSVLIRRSLECICIDQKADGNTLKEKIDNLAKRKIIPESLSRMANAIRYIGNIGAHPSSENIDYDDVEILDDFFTAIVEYVYIAPEKLKKLLEKLKKKNSQKIIQI